jgi:hypothetical protein
MKQASGIHITDPTAVDVRANCNDLPAIFITSESNVKINSNALIRAFHSSDNYIYLPMIFPSPRWVAGGGARRQ